MKRRDIIRKLREAGLTFREGASHTIVERDGRKVSVISRQREINERIERQTGVKLK